MKNKKSFSENDFSTPTSYIQKEHKNGLFYWKCLYISYNKLFIGLSFES